MQFVKSKKGLKRTVTAILVGSAFASSVAISGIPNFDAPMFGEAGLHIGRALENGDQIINDYSVKFELDELYHSLNMSFGANIKYHSEQSQLQHSESMHNFMVNENNEPIENICRVISASTTGHTESHRKNVVIEQQDRHQHNSVGAHSVDITNNGVSYQGGDLVDDSGAIPKSSVAEVHYERNRKLVQNLEAQKTCWVEDFESDEARYAACLAEADNPSNIQGEYIMNDKAFLSYDETTEWAMYDFADLVAPPYISNTPELDATTNEGVLDSIINQTYSSLASSMMHDVVSRRVAGEDTESEMALMDALDGMYYGNMNTPHDETLAYKFANSELSTPTYMLREMATMQALNIHLSIQEYKTSLNKEVALSKQLIDTYKGS